MSKLKKQLESKMRVHYQDCDPFNHLNNSKYIDYMLAARTEQLVENYDFNTSKIAQKQGIGWVTAQTQISYLFPATWLEIVSIETKLIEFSEGSLMIEAIMWDENKSHIKAILWSKMVHFDIKTQRSHKHTEELMKLFGEVHYPIEQRSTFENRVRDLRELQLAK